MGFYVIEEDVRGDRPYSLTAVFGSGANARLVKINFHYREFGGSENGRKKQAAWCTAFGPNKLKYRSKTVTVPVGAPPDELTIAGRKAYAEVLDYMTVLYKMEVL